MTKKQFKELAKSQYGNLLGVKLYNIKKPEVMEITSVIDGNFFMSPLFLGHGEAPNTVVDETNCEDYEELITSFTKLDPVQFAALIHIKMELDKLYSKFNF